MRNVTKITFIFYIALSTMKKKLKKDLKCLVFLRKKKKITGIYLGRD